MQVAKKYQQNQRLALAGIQIYESKQARLLATRGAAWTLLGLPQNLLMTHTVIVKSNGCLFFNQILSSNILCGSQMYKIHRGEKLLFSENGDPPKLPL